MITLMTKNDKKYSSYNTQSIWNTKFFISKIITHDEIFELIQLPKGLECWYNTDGIVQEIKGCPENITH